MFVPHPYIDSFYYIHAIQEANRTLGFDKIKYYPLQTLVDFDSLYFMGGEI